MEWREPKNVNGEEVNSTQEETRWQVAGGGLNHSNMAGVKTRTLYRRYLKSGCLPLPSKLSTKLTKTIGETKISMGWSCGTYHGQVRSLFLSTMPQPWECITVKLFIFFVDSLYTFVILTTLPASLHMDAIINIDETFFYQFGAIFYFFEIIK